MSAVLKPIPRKRATRSHDDTVILARGAPGETFVAPSGDDEAAGHIDNGAQNGIAGRTPSIDPQLIAAIRSLHSEHRGLQAGVTAMTLRIKSSERWEAAARIRREGGKLDPKKFPKPTNRDKMAVMQLRERYYSARHGLEQLRKSCLKDLLKPTKMLPVVPWVKTVKGLGLPSLAAIVGEAGDLSLYPNPAKLWKRFGLHVTDGKAAAPVAGEKLEYNPRRRAEAHVVGANLLKVNGPYADLYRTRKAFEIAKLAAIGIGVKPAKKIAKKDKDKFMSAKQVHMRALRYIEKRLLLDLWRAWREANETVSPSGSLLPADNSEMPA